MTLVLFLNDSYQRLATSFSDYFPQRLLPTTERFPQNGRPVGFLHEGPFDSASFLIGSWNFGNEFAHRDAEHATPR